MINHSTKSPLRRHKDVSPGAKQLLSVRRLWFTARPSGCVRLGCQPLNQKTVWRCQADKEHKTKSAVPVKSCNMDTFRWWRQRSLRLLSVAIMAIRSVTHSINQTDYWFVYPQGLGERSETAVSVPASCSLPLSVSLQPRLISAFQLSLILLLHCPPHKVFWANFTSVLRCWKFLCTLSAISAAESWLCVLSLIQSLSAFPGRAQWKLLI